MTERQLLERFGQIARLLLGDFRQVIGASNTLWLEQRIAHDDWQITDDARLRELLPLLLRWMLP
jgi:hypothetical protein